MRRLLIALLGAALVLLTGAPITASAAGLGMTPLSGSADPIVLNHSATDVGPLPGDTVITFLVGVPSQNTAGLKQVAQAQAKSHTQLGLAQVTAEFGASSATISAVEQYFENQGFILRGVEPGGLALSFEGTASQVNATFHTVLTRYTHKGVTGYAPDGTLSMPTYLQGSVTGVLGLDTLVKPIDNLKPIGKTSMPSFSNAMFTPLQLQTAYHVIPLLQNGYDGSGQTIAIATWAPYDLSDVTGFASKMGLPNVQLATGAAPYVVVGSAGNVPADVAGQGGTDETTVDMEWSHSFAPGATQEVAVGDLTADPDFLQSMYNVFSALQSGDGGLLSVPNVISTSWGYQENEAPVESNQMLDQLFSELAAQGITVFVASGDGDVQDENVLFPGSDPFVVSVGGTQLTVGTDGSYMGETAWGDAPFNEFYTASTGGYSEQFAAPPWALMSQLQYVPQSQPTVPYLPGMRGVPDVSLNSVNYLAEWQGEYWGFLGTSLAAPSWAGIYADMNQMTLHQTGTSLGFIAPELYANGDGTAFHDIMSGGNGEFDANFGWDPVTGLGTPDVAALASALVASIQQNTAATMSPFISAVSPTSANDNWLGTDPLPWIGTSRQYAPLTDSLVPDAAATISGYGFGSSPGTVALVEGSGTQIPLPVESWNNNEIQLQQLGANIAPPAVYQLQVYDASGNPVATMEVNLEGAITLDSETPLTVDTTYVSTAVYAGATVNVPAVEVNPDGTSSYTDTIVTLGDADGFSTSAQVTDGQYLGTNSYGFPQWFVPAGNAIDVQDMAAESVMAIVEAAQGSAAPGQAEINFLSGAASTLMVQPLGSTVESATYDPSQSTTIFAMMMDSSGDGLSGGTFDVSATASSNTGLTPYYLDANGNWDPMSTVSDGVYGGIAGPLELSVPDPVPNDTVSVAVYEATTGSSKTVTLSTVSQSQIQVTAADTTAGQLAPLTIEEQDANGTVVSSVYQDVSVSTTATLFDGNGDQMVPSGGAYTVPLVKGVAQLYFATVTAGPTDIYVSDPSVAGLFGSATPNVQSDPNSLALSAYVLGATGIGTPKQQVSVALTDMYGNTQPFNDTLGLQVFAQLGGPPAGTITVYDSNGNPIAPNASGIYEQPAQSGSATYYISSSVPQELQYVVTDETHPPVDYTAFGDFLSPYAVQLNLGTQGGVIDNGTIWAGVPQQVTITATDSSGNVVTSNEDTVDLTITPPSGGTLTVSAAPIAGKTDVYAVQMQGGEAVVQVQSSLSGTIKYQVADASVSSVQSTSASQYQNQYPMHIDTTSGLTFTDPNGNTVNVATTALKVGEQYDVAFTVQNYGKSMTAVPILEIIGPNGQVADLYGVASVVDGQTVVTYSQFTPMVSGTYTVEGLVWSAWLPSGGQVVGPMYQQVVQAQ